MSGGGAVGIGRGGGRVGSRGVRAAGGMRHGIIHGGSTGLLSCVGHAEGALLDDTKAPRR